VTEKASIPKADTGTEQAIARFAKDLSEPLVPVTPDTTNTLVHQYLVKNPGVETIAVVRDGVPIGLINRHTFMEGFGRAFGRELFGRDGCTTFMFEYPLIIEESATVEALVKAALDDGGGALKDGFIVTRQGQYVGMGSGFSLLKSMSDIEAQKTKMLMSSINYASLIQQSHLADSDRALTAYFKDYGILWDPRDVVGGDAYFFRRTSKGVLGCSFDCTGHGVPGAFMTLIVLSFFEQYFEEATIDEHADPGTALTKLHQYVRRVLQQNDEATRKASNDGLDAFMFTLEDGSTTIKYAAAKLHLIVVTPDGEVSSEDGDKAGIGYFDTPADAVWKTYELTVPQGSVMTIATDGVIDQVGGPKKIAFGKKRIGTFVQKHLNQSAKDLVTGFQQVYLDWQGEQKRRDDVSIFIFRLNP